MWVDDLRGRKGEWSDFRLHLGVFRSNSALKEADRCLHLMGFALWFRFRAIWSPSLALQCDRQGQVDFFLCKRFVLGIHLSWVGWLWANLLPSWIASYVIDRLVLEQIFEIRFSGICDCVVGTACYRWKGEAREIKAIHMARCVNLSSTSTMQLTMFSIPLVPGYFLALCLFVYAN